MNARRPRRLRPRYRRIRQVLEAHGLGVGLGLIGLGSWVPFHHGVLGHATRDAPYTTPEHVRLALEELGPTFIKLGQLLSTRPDLLPAEYAAELAKLQDDAPPEPWDAIQSVIREELGAEPDRVFAQFDATPLASASIGQAHAAVRADGTPVVVKVRRPGAVDQIHLDLEILRDLADRASVGSPVAGRWDLSGLVEEFSRTLLAELDYEQEARNAERFATDFAESTDVAIPRVFWETTTPRVLTLQRVDGIKIVDLEALDAAGIDRTHLARRGAELVLTMIFENRFFHADPHPGNMFVQPDGSLTLIDFGMVGTVSEETADHLADMLVAFMSGDAEALGAALIALSRARDMSDPDGLHRGLAAFVARYRDRALAEINFGRLLGELLTLLRRHRLRLPHETALLFKVLMMAEGLGERLDPTFAMADVLTPFSQRLIDRRFSLASLARRWAHASVDAGNLLLDLPASLQRLRRVLDSGGFEVHLRAAELEPLVARAERVGNRLVAALVAAALINGIGGLVKGNTQWKTREATMIGAGFTTITALGGYLLWTVRRRS